MSSNQHFAAFSDAVIAVAGEPIRDMFYDPDKGVTVYRDSRYNPGAGGYRLLNYMFTSVVNGPLSVSDSQKLSISINSDERTVNLDIFGVPLYAYGFSSRIRDEQGQAIMFKAIASDQDDRDFHISIEESIAELTGIPRGNFDSIGITGFYTPGKDFPQALARSIGMSRIKSQKTKRFPIKTYTSRQKFEAPKTRLPEHVDDYYRQLRWSHKPMVTISLKLWQDIVYSHYNPLKPFITPDKNYFLGTNYSDRKILIDELSQVQLYNQYVSWEQYVGNTLWWRAKEFYNRHKELFTEYRSIEDEPDW